jgi:hypothetical protein
MSSFIILAILFEYWHSIQIHFFSFIGKGNYWTIHPACIDDFANGDFRRRQARRRARKCLKDTNQHYVTSAHRYNIGYVPMTASHIAFHPYNNASGGSSMYYPQPHVYPQLAQAHQQSTSASAFSYASQPQTSYLSACALSDQQSKTSSASLPAHKLLADQASSAALTMQAFAQQQMASNLQFQSW